jgi:hypothetical protein
MRLLFCSIASLLLALLVIGCNTVSPDECWPNTSGGFGGSGTIPIGAGVGATSTGDFDSPNGGTPNPCVTPSDDTTPTPPTEMGTYIRCLGMDAMTCEAMCFDIGATCSGLAQNPGRPELGVGKLKQCMRNTTLGTCTYCFLGGSISCSQIKAFGKPIWWLCNLPGGKGCE